MSKLGKALMLAALSAAPTRRLVNARYARLDRAAKTRFHEHYAKLFTRYRPPVQPGEWQVAFAGRTLSVPLRRKTIWLDWDVAASLVAHDPEVKDFYELLGSGPAPTLFLDVGANYGTHSLLIASMGIETVAFEPNSTCIRYGRALAAHNGAEVEWQHVAVGAADGEITLAYPREATWLGTTTGALDKRADLIRETVALIPLDRFAHRTQGRDVLIKIDVEGLELAVLKGAERILAQGVRLLFESNGPADRPALLDHLAQRGYAIAEPPFERPISLTTDAFIASPETNFLAWRV